jgi:hypothetical protein
LNDINFAFSGMDINKYYESFEQDRPRGSFSKFILSRKQIIFIKSYRVLTSISNFFKSIGYYQGFHYIAIFLTNLDFTEEVSKNTFL